MIESTAPLSAIGDDELLVSCPECGATDARLRLARRGGGLRGHDDAVVVMFSCVNDRDPRHGCPSDADLLAGVPGMGARPARRIPWWEQLTARTVLG